MQPKGFEMDDLILRTWQTAAGCNTPVMQAAAQSFAQLDHLAYWCYQLAAVGDNAAYEHVAASVAAGLSALVTADKLSARYAPAVLRAVMYEINMPCTQRPFSGRQRAAAANIAQKSWSRHNLCQYSDAILKQLDAALGRAERDTRYQTIEAISQ